MSTEPAQAALWHLVVGEVVASPDPWSSRRAWTEAALQELHVLGERPTARELHAFLEAQLPDVDVSVRGQVVNLWRTRLRLPRGCPRSMRQLGRYPYDYPFAEPERLAAAHALPSPGAMLVDRVALTSERFLRQAESGEADEAWYELRLSIRGLAVWGATRDRVDEAGWPPGSLVPSRESRPCEHWTHEGRAREEARLERVHREVEEVTTGL